MTTVAIIGYGELGKALSKLLEHGGSNVRFWDKDETKVPGQGTLAETANTADVIFLCIPSWAVRGALNGIASSLNSSTLIVGFSKGIEKNTLKTMDEVLAETLPKGQPWVLVGGPMIAEELMRDAPGAGVVAMPDETNFKRLAALFIKAPLVLEQSMDIHGVALSSVLKNVYAIGAGIVDGLELGWNAKGWYLARAANEITSIVELLGGNRETALGTAGLGDLIATGCSAQSRNHQIGIELIRTGTCCLEGEGSVSFPLLRTLLGDHAHQYQVFSALVQIISDGKSAKDIFLQLFIKSS